MSKKIKTCCERQFASAELFVGLSTRQKNAGMRALDTSQYFNFSFSVSGSFSSHKYIFQFLWLNHTVLQIYCLFPLGQLACLPPLCLKAALCLWMTFHSKQFVKRKPSFITVQFCRCFVTFVVMVIKMCSLWSKSFRGGCSSGSRAGCPVRSLVWIPGHVK